MFRLFRNHRQCAFCLVLLGLGLILFGIPAISEANNAAVVTPPQRITLDFECENCHPVALTISQAQLDVLTTQSDPCDICHTDIINTDNPLVEKADQIEQDLRTTSARVFQVRQSSKYLAQDARIGQAVKLLAQAKIALQAGRLDIAQDFVAQAEGLIAQAENEAHFKSLIHLTQQAVSLVGVSSRSPKYYLQLALNGRTLELFDSSQETSSKIFIFDISPRIHFNAEAMHRRAPPVEEDAVQMFQLDTSFSRLPSLMGVQSFLFSLSIGEIHGWQPYIRSYFRL